MRGTQAASPLYQGWLLVELGSRFGMGLEELGRRFDRTPSWVSRRLALVRDLPSSIQDLVRLGKLAPDTAMKVLVPLSRDNAQDAPRFAEAIVRAHLSTREAHALHAGWLRGEPGGPGNGSWRIRPCSCGPGRRSRRMRGVCWQTCAASGKRPTGPCTASRKVRVAAIPPSSLQEPRTACEGPVHPPGKGVGPCLRKRSAPPSWNSRPWANRTGPSPSVVRVSRTSVQKVLKSHMREVPELARAEKAASWHRGHPDAA